MRQGILITYRYAGDEARWAAVTRAFTEAIAADTALAGKFSYHIQKAADGIGRIHIGRWDSDATVKLMQSRPCFETFAAALREMAGATLVSQRFEVTSASTLPAEAAA
jgi:hypothetical protein